MKYLVVVDMQNDFISGVLGTNEAACVVDKVKCLCESFDGEIIFTRDTHGKNYLDTQEGRNLPVEHCIKDTYGWQITEELREFADKAHIIDKPTFASVELGEYLKGKKDVESIMLCGVCTDICVISNAMLLKAYLPEIPVAVKENACAGVSQKAHCNAIDAMKCCQIEIL